MPHQTVSGMAAPNERGMGKCTFECQAVEFYSQGLSRCEVERAVPKKSNYTHDPYQTIQSQLL
jgi:hypothetical protein